MTSRAMNHRAAPALLFAMTLALAACKAQAPTPQPEPAAPQVTADTSAQPARSTDAPLPSEDASLAPVASPAAALPAAFVDKVWKVGKSSAVEPGTTYAFLADGTLVIDSPNGTPMRGRWSFDKGALVMVEEGISYPTEIIAIDDKQFHIRSHNPGEPVDIELVPAPGEPLPKP